MRSFESVLREVEQDRPETILPPTPPFLLAPDLARAGAVAHRCGRDAYAKETSGPPHDLRTLLLNELAAARSSRRRLQDLRRRLARTLHPDRTEAAGAASLLAELNAGIDAALKELAS